jgi:hypothetical protein
MDSNFVLSKYKIDFGKIPINSIKEDYVTMSDPDRLHYWGVQCGCTSVKIDGNKVKVKFDTRSSVGKDLAKGEFSSSQYRYIRLYLDKDVPEFIQDPKTLKKIDNPDKIVIQINIDYVAFG